MVTKKTGVAQSIQIEIVANKPDHMDMKTFVDLLESQGNTVLEINELRGTVKCVDYTTQNENVIPVKMVIVYDCEFCSNHKSIHLDNVVEHEKECVLNIDTIKGA